MSRFLRRRSILALAVFLTACHHDAPTQAAQWPLLADVYMPNISAYSPNETDIAMTGTVRFNFPLEQHNVVFINPGPGTPADIPITANSVVPRQFSVAGTFNYYCTLHPQMVGVVIVH